MKTTGVIRKLDELGKSRFLLNCAEALIWMSRMALRSRFRTTVLSLRKRNVQTSSPAVQTIFWNMKEKKYPEHPSLPQPSQPDLPQLNLSLQLLQPSFRGGFFCVRSPPRFIWFSCYFRQRGCLPLPILYNSGFACSCKEKFQVISNKNPLPKLSITANKFTDFWPVICSVFEDCFLPNTL